MSEERSAMFPENVNWNAFPEQKAYKITVDKTESFKLNTIQSHPVIWTNEIKMYMMEGEPGGGIDWHTHTPALDQINVSYEGTARYTLEREDGEYQDIDIGPGELVYLPGGARHKMEVIGDEYHKEFSIYRAVNVARIEMMDEDFGTGEDAGIEYDMENWPVGLWMDRERNEVVKKDENAVSEGRITNPDE